LAQNTLSQAPQGTTLLQVEGYLKFFYLKTLKYHAIQDVVVVKNFEKKYWKYFATTSRGV